MPAITYDGDSATAMQTLLDIVSGMDGARVVSSEDEYIHFEFSTPLFRFVDDVEFLLDADDSMIHFRSASRERTSDQFGRGFVEIGAGFGRELQFERNEEIFDFGPGVVLRVGLTR